MWQKWFTLCFDYQEQKQIKVFASRTFCNKKKGKTQLCLQMVVYIDLKWQALSIGPV